MNRDTAVSVARALNDVAQEQDSRKRMVYMSGSANPPFIERYLSTKLEAEKMMNALENVDIVSLRAGFIYSWDDRKWSVPLKYIVDADNCILGRTLKFVPESPLKSFLNNFHTDSSIDLNDVINSAIYGGFCQEFLNDYLTNNDMQTISNQFVKSGYKVGL